MEAIFWIAVSLLFYTYIGYGLLLVLLNGFRKKIKVPEDHFTMPVTFIVPAYNEEHIIEKKIQNCLALVYPADAIFFIFVTDGSTDGTVEILRKYPQVTLLHQSQREGKSAAIHRAMSHVTTPVVIFSDANTLIHELSAHYLIRHYADEKVGGVSGEKRIKDKEASVVGFGEQLYWRYESLLKEANGVFYTIVGAAGELFSIRTNLYQPVEASVILDDFVISARVCEQGYRFLYESKAYGVETSSISMMEERKRKVRISTGSFQALRLLNGLLNPLKNFKVFFQYMSHRVLRWVACPLLLPLVLFINALLFFQDAGWIYNLAFWMQLSFYFTAFAGWLVAGKSRVVKGFFIPYYFIFMILAQYKGFWRFATRRQSGIWEKAVRKKSVEVNSFTQDL